LEEYITSIFRVEEYAKQGTSVMKAASKKKKNSLQKTWDYTQITGNSKANLSIPTGFLSQRG
jgi:hypothetical protein